MELSDDLFNGMVGVGAVASAAFLTSVLVFPQLRELRDVIFPFLAKKDTPPRRTDSRPPSDKKAVDSKAAIYEGYYPDGED